jgi:hypothetical protein
MAMNSIPEDIRTDERRIRLLVGEGTLDQHTDAPYDRTRIERYAFPDIRHMMIGLAGSLALETVKLQPVSKAA